MSKAATIRLFLALVAGFMLATVAGTLSHEAGHYLVARSLGYRVSINYGAMTWTGEQHFRSRDILFILWGGPLQTMLTGTLGVLLLWRCRRSFLPGKPLAFWQWFLVFLSLFWLRQPANLATGVGTWLRTGHAPRSGDETRLAAYYHWPPVTILALTALIGMLILALVVFRFIPRGQRILFMASGLLGGVSGYVLWLHGLGPVLMP